MSFYIPHERSVLDTGEFTFTKQAPKEECDINNILAQYKRTGILEHISARQGQYVDLPSECDLQSAFEVVREAKEAFAGLPAKVRDRFENDPLQFLAAFENPAMRGELEELGVILKAPVAPVEAPAEV